MKILENLFFEFSDLSFDYRYSDRLFTCLKKIYLYRLRYSAQVGDTVDFSSFDNYNPSIEVFRSYDWEDY